MSAYEGSRCVECNSENLNPRHSGEKGVYYCRCEDCGYEGNYLLPETDDNDNDGLDGIGKMLLFLILFFGALTVISQLTIWLGGLIAHV